MLKSYNIIQGILFQFIYQKKLAIITFLFDFRWAKASASVKAAYQAKSDKDKARYAAEKAKFAAKK